MCYLLVIIFEFWCLDGFRLFDSQSFHQPLDLLRCQFARLRFISQPTERTVIEAFIQQQKSVSLPQQPFYLSAVSSAEQVKAPAERIQGQLSLNDGGKTVDSFSHIRISGDQIHVTTTGKFTEHFSAPSEPLTGFLPNIRRAELFSYHRWKSQYYPKCFSCSTEQLGFL